MLIAKLSYFAKNVQNKKCAKKLNFFEKPLAQRIQIQGKLKIFNFFAKAVQSNSFC